MMGNGNEQISSNHDSTTGETQNENDNNVSDVGNGRINSDDMLTGEDVTHMTTKKSAFKTPFTNFSKGEKALLGLTILFIAAFAASLSSSLLGKPLCPNKQGNLVSLAILGTVAAIISVVSLVHFCCPSKSKEEGKPSNQLQMNEISEVFDGKSMSSNYIGKS